MNRVVLGGVALLLSVPFAAADGPTLANEKLVLKRDRAYVPADDDKKWTTPWPDETVLYRLRDRKAR